MFENFNLVIQPIEKLGKSLKKWRDSVLNNPDNLSNANRFISETSRYFLSYFPESKGFHKEDVAVLFLIMFKANILRLVSEKEYKQLYHQVNMAYKA